MCALDVRKGFISQYCVYFHIDRSPISCAIIGNQNVPATANHSYNNNIMNTFLTVSIKIEHFELCVLVFLGHSVCNASLCAGVPKMYFHGNVALLLYECACLHHCLHVCVCERVPDGLLMVSRWVRRRAALPFWL